MRLDYWPHPADVYLRAKEELPNGFTELREREDERREGLEGPQRSRQPDALGQSVCSGLRLFCCAFGSGEKLVGRTARQEGRARRLQFRRLAGSQTRRLADLQTCRLCESMRRVAMLESGRICGISLRVAVSIRSLE